MSGLYGVVEGQRRAREWLPHLRTPGQRVVLGVMLAFCGLDGLIQPTYGQIAELAGYHPSSARKIVGQLERMGALMRAGERPVLDAEGVARGGRVIVWSIPTRASEGAHGNTSQPRRAAIPSAPFNGSKRASRGAPLKVGKLKSLEHTTGGVAERFEPSQCPHNAKDDEGYCTACWTQFERVR